MKIKHFLGYKIIFLPSGKVLGVYTISDLLMEKAAHVWESREQFFSNVRLELERVQENHRKLNWYDGLPKFLGKTKSNRRFWLKEELAALRYAIVGLQEALRYESPHGVEPISAFVELGKKIKGATTSTED